MSAQEFKPGDKVRGKDYARLPIGSVATHSSGTTITKIGPDEWVGDWDADDRLPSNLLITERTLTRLGDGTHAEPEDKDDLYVEPEPLKAGDAVLVWVRVAGTDYLDEVDVQFSRIDDSTESQLVRADTIVRPDAGQVPPWVKPAQCTSLVERTADSLPVLMRCEHEAGHEAKHVVGWVAWTDAEAYGRVAVSS